MSDSFKYGGVSFPLSAASAESLLRDADPAVYYTIEFLTAALNSHLSARLIAEAQAAGVTDIASAVADSMPIDPEQFLNEEHLKFPLLTVHREGSSFKYMTNKRFAIHRLKCAYILPPMRAAQAERLLPILHAAGLLIDRKCAEGKDTEYTPTAPTGLAGEFIWTKERAGVSKVEIKDSVTGAFQVSNELYFPAVMLSLEMWETSLVDGNDGTYDDFEGADAGIYLRQEADGTIYGPVADVSTQLPPTVTSISPATGSAAGGTSVTITGTNFQVGTRPIVLFDGAAADAVSVVNATTITCRTPPHAAYPTFVADLMVIASDGQDATLSSAFTFTNP